MPSRPSAATRQSFETIFASHCRPNGEEFRADGFRHIEAAFNRCGEPPPLPTPAIVAGGRDLVAYQSYSAAMTALDGAMAQCKPLRIDCRFFIGPIHANYLVLIHETGFDHYLAWKAALIDMARKNSVEIFDLSTGHPASSLPFSRTRGHFYDLLHYDAAIGHDILLRAHIPAGHFMLGAFPGQRHAQHNADL